MEKHETARQLRKVAHFFKGIVEAADDLEALGSIEGATAEAIKARDAAAAERDAALAALDATKTKAQEIIADAQAEAIRIRAEADARLEDAKAEVDVLLSGAHAVAKAKAADTAEKCAAAMQAAQERVDALRSDDDTLSADILAKHQELDALSDQLADAMATIARADKLRAALNA